MTYFKYEKRGGIFFLLGKKLDMEQFFPPKNKPKTKNSITQNHKGIELKKKNVIDINNTKIHNSIPSTFPPPSPLRPLCPVPALNFPLSSLSLPIDSAMSFSFEAQLKEKNPEEKAPPRSPTQVFPFPFPFTSLFSLCKIVP